jgi:cation diffusion facilitator family transporter
MLRLSEMSPQRRTALISVAAAVGLIAIKLSVGLASDSLGLLSEAVHSGTDLVAALLTFFALGVAGRPADREHPYGHGKAEHLAALAEATFLIAASLFIGVQAVRALVSGEHAPNAAWWTFAAIGAVIALDAGRAFASVRAARRYGSAALAANALHFAGDLAGTLAVLIGLLLTRAGHPAADPAAAIFVACLVLVAAARLVRTNADILLDRAPASATERARDAIEALSPEVELRRLRLRSAAGRIFADAVIGVPPADAVGQGHAAASAVEDALAEALPGSDVVVHVEPRSGEGDLRERVLAAALSVAGVREVHNVRLLEVDGRAQASLHIKLEGGLALRDAHALATEVEAAVVHEVPELDAVTTHLEPLDDPGPAPARQGARAAEAAAVRRAARDVTGREPDEVRLVETAQGPVAYVTVGLPARTPLVDAHAQAAEIRRRARSSAPRLADVFVHTEDRASGAGAGQPAT